MESLYEEAKTKAGDLDEDDIQKLIEKGDYDPYFENKTTRMVIEEVQQELYQANIENIETSLKKLIGYRYIDEVSDLLRGRHVKWMNLTKQKKTLTGGGIIMNIKFLDNGVHILCNNGSRFTQYKFDDCITFQKLSQQEELILMANEYLDADVEIIE